VDTSLLRYVFSATSPYWGKGCMKQLKNFPLFKALLAESSAAFIPNDFHVVLPGTVQLQNRKHFFYSFDT